MKNILIPIDLLIIVARHLGILRIHSVKIFSAFISLIPFIFSFFFPFITHAANLTFVRDVISTSAPGIQADHTVTFSVPNAIPPSGFIEIELDPGAFNIPSGFKHSDMDIAVSTTSLIFVERLLALSQSATEDGVAVVTGSNGTIIIELNSTEGIPKGASVRIKLGKHSTFQSTGFNSIQNPTGVASYRIIFTTKSNGSTQIDKGVGMVAIISQVVSSADRADGDPPIITNGLPSGAISHGITNVEISVATDEVATCKFSLTASTTYALMANTFSNTLSKLHMTVVTGITDDTAYNFYVRCKDTHGNANTSDFLISFTTKPVPPPGGIPVVGGGGTGLPGGPFTPQTETLPFARVFLSGMAPPLSTVSFLKDGVLVQTLTPNTSGIFNVELANLERGAYTFGIFAVDSNKIKSQTITSTISLVAGTSNDINSLFIPPTVSLDRDTVDEGASAFVRGESIPKSSISVHIQKQGSAIFSETSGKIIKVIANDVGEWSSEIDTVGFATGTYEIRARFSKEGNESNYGQIIYLGVGEPPSPDFSIRSDINRDGKVNLVDFSIMIFNFGSSDSSSDINLDGIVNLADFSIMIFNWTG